MTTPSVAQRLAPLLAEIAAGAPARERDRELPFAVVQQLREAGFGALRLPVEAGGSGVGYAELVEILIELGRADSNLPQLLRGHIGFVEQLLARPASPAKDRWLARVAAGELVGNAQSEPGSTPFWKPETTVTRTESGWRVDGRKFYSTGSLFADWIFTSGSADGDWADALVRADGPGVERIDDWDGFGQRLTGSGTTVFDGAPVDVDDVEVHAQGARPATTLSATFQLVHLATLSGIGRRALDDVVEFVRGRTRSGFTARIQTPAEDPQVQQVVGEVAGFIYAAKATTLAAARTVEAVKALELAGTATTADLGRADAAVFTAQGVVIDLVLRATSDAFRVGGASAVAEHRVLDRHWRNARTVSSHNPEVFRARSVGEYLLSGRTPHEQLVVDLAAGSHDQARPTHSAQAGPTPVSPVTEEVSA